MPLRLIAFVILLISVIFAPFWLSVILAFICILYFPKFWECVPVFLVSDLLYGVSEPRFYGIRLVAFFGSIISLLVLEFIKKKLKFYQN